MKVYVLVEYDYGGDAIRGVYASLDDASAEITARESGGDRASYGIEDFDVIEAAGEQNPTAFRSQELRAKAARYSRQAGGYYDD